MSLPEEPGFPGYEQSVASPGRLEIPADLPPETDIPASESPLWRAILREVAETLALAAVIWLVVNFTTARYIVLGSSMEPNLSTGQFLLVNRLAYEFGPVERGDIIIFDYPGNTSDDYVKRVIGLPGDEVRITEGYVYVNDTPLVEPYLTEMTPGAGIWAVPSGSYFVMGDNRDGSSDSRVWGTLADEYIIGKALFSYWPIRQIGPIPHFEYVVTR